MIEAAQFSGDRWRYLLLAFIALGSLALVFSLPPFAQDLKYHEFADRRAFLGIPNFADVFSNVAFLLVGIAGLAFCFGNESGSSKPAWIVLFAGLAFVSAGSSYYHWDPKNATLVWDRLPITIAFMGLFVALIGEYVSTRLAQVLLVPMPLLGLCSVLYWHWFDDLRPYLWVQVIALLTIPVVMILFRPRYTRQGLLLVAIGGYALAKVSEVHDREVFALTRNLFSGHSLKHVVAAMACFAIFWMLRTRKPLSLPA